MESILRIRCNLTNRKTAVEPPPNTAMIAASGERGYPVPETAIARLASNKNVSYL